MSAFVGVCLNSTATVYQQWAECYNSENIYYLLFVTARP